MPPRVNTGIIGTSPKWSCTEDCGTGEPAVWLDVVFSVGGTKTYRPHFGALGVPAQRVVEGLLWAFEDKPSQVDVQRSPTWVLEGFTVTHVPENYDDVGRGIEIALQGLPVVGLLGIVFVLGTRTEIEWRWERIGSSDYGLWNDIPVKQEHVLFGISPAGEPGQPYSGKIYCERVLASVNLHLSKPAPTDGKPAPFPKSLAYGADGTLYLLRGRTLVRAFTDREGLDQMELPFTPFDSAPAIDSDGMLYFLGDSTIWKVDPKEARQLWTFNVTSPISKSISSEICVGPGPETILYVGTSGGEVVAISSDGIEKWRSAALGKNCTTPVLDEQGVIHLGTSSGVSANPLLRLHRLQPSGALIGSVQCGQLIQPVAVASDGWVYAPGNDEILYAFTPSGPGEEQGLLHIGIPQSSPAIRHRAEGEQYGTLYIRTGHYIYSGQEKKFVWELVAVNILSSDESSNWATGRANSARTSSAQVLDVSSDWTVAYKSLLPKSSELGLLRRFRDVVIARDKTRGIDYLSWLYRDSRHLLEVLDRDEALQKQARALLRSNVGAIAAVLAGKTGVINNPNAIVGFLQQLSLRSNPALRTLCGRVSADLRTCQKVGQPFFGLRLAAPKAPPRSSYGRARR
jgi:outer membrane protein assembly factor BamB